MPLAGSSKLNGRAYAYRLAALALVVFAAVTFLRRPNGFGIESLAFSATLLSIWLIRQSNRYVRKARGQTVVDLSISERAKRVGRLTWILTGVSLAACVVFVGLMYIDALRGGKAAWPAYACGGAVIALALATGTLAAKLFR